jgi:hypothetical protein
MEVLREQWMWNRETRSMWLWVFIASGVILGAILYPLQGVMGLAAGFLPFLLACAILGPIYGHVDRKVRALRESLAGEEGDVAEGLANIGSVQGPAIVIMKETELVLVPLVGKRLTVRQGASEQAHRFRCGTVSGRPLARPAEPGEAAQCLKR